MLNFILFLLFGLAVFFLSLIEYKNYKSTTLYALAIGGAVNANFFHAGAYPVCCFGLPFGIDSLIYTLFAFCVMVMLIEEKKKDAYLLAFSSIIAILFSACMQLVADLLSKGSAPIVWTTFFTFCISAFACVVAVIVAVEIVARIKGKCNIYACMLMGIAVIVVLDSSIYYSLVALIHTLPNDIWLYLLASILGKIIALLCSVLTLWIMQIRKKKLQKNASL